jgi:hypothetical protein
MSPVLARITAAAVEALSATAGAAVLAVGVEVGVITVVVEAVEAAAGRVAAAGIEDIKQPDTGSRASYC